MASPTLLQVKAFDKSTEKQFEFTYTGNQPVKNHLKIYKNSDLSLIYDQTITTLQLNHTVPANTLTNGIQYYAVISVIDSSNNESTFSSPVLFYCYTSPTFSLNITENQIIQSSTYLVEMTYSQIENELLREFEINLYDANLAQIFTTNVLYPTTTISAMISSLIDSSQYNIRATGVTMEGTELDTGYIKFSVTYIQPALFSKVELTNLPHQAMVKIKSNMISIDGISNPSPPTYINNEKIDLTANGSYVIFDSGFSINGDFTRERLIEKITSYSIIDELSNGIDKIKIIQMIGKFEGDTENKIYCVLTASNSIFNYRICSNKLSVPSDSQQLYVLYQRKNNLYDIKIALKT